MNNKYFAPILILLLSTISLLSCKQDANKEIRSQAVRFYSGYKGDFRTADRTVFTREMGALMDQTAAMEKEEAAKMKAGSTPTDKPRMIEGDVLCGLYEGFTQYEIAEIRDLKNEAAVSVKLKNTPYNFEWTDTLMLKNQNGWKIDDIRFGRNQGYASSSRDVFTQFLDLK
jgi:hypothetical protein